MPWLPSQAAFQKAVIYCVLSLGMPSETAASCRAVHQGSHRKAVKTGFGFTSLYIPLLLSLPALSNLLWRCAPYFVSLLSIGWAVREIVCNVACIWFTDPGLFSVFTASPDNPAVHGDPGEPAFHCRARPSHPGCVPAVLCSTGLIAMFLPFLLSWNNLSYFLMV